MTEPGGPPLRLGLAGAGAISQVVHLPILSERSDVVIAAISDADEMKAATIGKRFGVDRIIGDEELCTDSDIDGIVVCAPSYRHEELAIRALESGKHVLVERPLALTADGVRRIVKAAEGSPAGLVVGMAHRYRPDVSALRSFIAGGELGDLSAVQASWLNRRIRLVRTTWRQRAGEAGGGALMDLGVQALDLALWILGYPRIQQVRARMYGDEYEVEEEVHLNAVTEAGTTLTLAASWRYHGADDLRELRVLGSEGSACLPPLSLYKQLGGRPLEVTPRQPIPRGGEDLFINAHRRQIDHFLRIIEGQAEAPPPHEQAILMGLVEGAYRSAREEREVDLA